MSEELFKPLTYGIRHVKRLPIVIMIKTFVHVCTEIITCSYEEFEWYACYHDMYDISL